MKKANRILMATVAVLLSLVLITTSVVSGIFARFTVLQEAKTKMTLNKFGVSLGLTLSDEFVELLGGQDAVDDMTTVNGDSISINITNLKMAPGDIWDKAFNVSIDGTPTVDCRFKCDIDLEMDNERFTIPAGECGYEIDTIYFPVNFTFGVIYAGTYYVKGYFGSRIAGYGVNNEEIMYGYFGGAGQPKIAFDVIEDGKGGYCGVVDFPVENGEITFWSPNNTSTKFKDFYLGFEWPFEADDLTNKKDTYIVDHNKETGIGFTYVLTLSLEQIG